MNEDRLNNAYLFVGDQGTGKTTVAAVFAAAFLALSETNRIIVIDTDAHPFYSEYDVVDIEGLKICKSKLIRCEEADEDELFKILNRYQRNAFVIFEDAAKYISANISKAVKACIIDKRKRNFDLAFMFHSLSDVPPYIARNNQAIVLFKTQDNLSKEQDKFRNWHIIKEAALKLQADKNHRSHVAINT